MYRAMTTCPTYLEECDKLRKLDSLENYILSQELLSEKQNSANKDIQIQKEKDKVKRANKRAVSGTILGFAIGIITILMVQ